MRRAQRHAPARRSRATARAASSPARPTPTAPPGQVCRENSCGLKPNGAFCADGRECASGNCAQGVCCATRLRERVQVLRAARDDGSVHERSRRSSPIRPGSASTGAPPAAAATAGARRVPARSTPRARLARSRPARRGRPPSHPPGPVTAPGRASDGRGDLLLPVPCGAAACNATCTADADCAPPAVCGERLVRPQARRRGLRRGRRVHERHLRAGRLLQDRLRGDVHVVRGGRQRRQLRRRSPRARAIRPASAATRARPAAARPASATGPAPASSTLRAPSARRHRARPARPPRSLARSCDGAGTCKPATTQSCAPYNLQRHHLPRRLRQRR